MAPINNGLSKFTLNVFQYKRFVNKNISNCEGFELNETHQIVIYVNDVNILGEIMNTINKNTESLLQAIMKFI
jgi:hypothetical protein